MLRLYFEIEIGTYVKAVEESLDEARGVQLVSRHGVVVT